ncbi:nitroreductase [Listeria fleischmannii 1991]|uniref:FMN reductase [NAD(P)H] n=2 Tax=Listeria fleischmannii TaxID=1069827 RepID=A0A2X3H9P6_9LIST|nr:NADPH-dependent oxidoreductase [Listeria fleischmannii]EMG28653.1 putative FMN-containing NADPH-linked nitro/flavin reductase [Listeria fleischmannii subsp. fleischmannii LU2006-1]KMT59620.1 nitroreductase [Listeria fleischmannii 1991]SQC67445.1 FMN reductase [NAD(P)H] [Listeria fleischmannii subsp. fleischmannii]
MNKVIEQMLNHRSIRQYIPGKSIPEEDLDLIIRAAKSAPSWINGQHYSIIGIKDPARKQKLAELTKNPYVAECSIFFVFVGDFYRVSLASAKHDTPFRAKSEEDLLLVAATDVGLACQNALTAAESLGYGTVCIGGIRREFTEVSEFLGLPEFVIPIVGLCIGYPDTNPKVKPRLPKEAVYFEETYQTDTLPLLEKYDTEIIPYSEREGSIGYTERLAKSYAEPYYKGILEGLKKQGYLGGNR